MNGRRNRRSPSIGPSQSMGVLCGSQGCHPSHEWGCKQHTHKQLVKMDLQSRLFSGCFVVSGSHEESSVGSRMRIDTMGYILNQEFALLRQHAVESESSNAHHVWWHWLILVQNRSLKGFITTQLIDTSRTLNDWVLVYIYSTGSESRVKGVYN